MFSSVANIVNSRPIAARSFTQDDFYAITPNDLLLQRTRNTVPGANYAAEESFTRRQEVLEELEQAWWQQWHVQVFPHLVPFNRWKTEHRAVQLNDIVHVLYEKKLGKGLYRLGRILAVHPDSHGKVRTVTVGLRRLDRREPSLPYVSRGLEEMKLGVQRIIVVGPA